MSEIRVLLVDDHAVVRDGFQRILESDERIRIIDSASNGQEAFEKFRTSEPDVVVLDLTMPNHDGDLDGSSISGGMEAIRRILAYDGKARVLVLSGCETRPYPTQVVGIGVRGYLTKHCAPAELIEAVVRIDSGDSYYSPVIQEQLDHPESCDASPVNVLSPRELQIFVLLAEGLPVSRVADQMFLSPKTVHAHRSNIKRKLALQSNSEIVHLALRHGLIDP
ncbi:DNA-binding response regulator [Marinobacterium nitratireducens]|uniref:DNA-binding response regulator n=1 Tax=Marinobacterium nitratireducens TaxID=518897 RepID=A0A917Z9I7_9GAMM|nr:response regulator transcription factor [Marinobacterium nitratireducens]GGO76655.1 DNA-binding response regulator [Marinobacterium nitratireducens]